jgi:hypothetical protein
MNESYTSVKLATNHLLKIKIWSDTQKENRTKYFHFLATFATKASSN